MRESLIVWGANGDQGTVVTAKHHEAIGTDLFGSYRFPILCRDSTPMTRLFNSGDRRVAAMFRASDDISGSGVLSVKSIRRFSRFIPFRVAIGGQHWGR